MGELTRWKSFMLSAMESGRSLLTTLRASSSTMSSCRKRPLRLSSIASHLSMTKGA